MNNQLWGEIPQKHDRERIAHDLAKMVIFSAIKPEGPKVKKTLCDVKTTNIIPADYSKTETYVAETIQLIQHARQVKELIRKRSFPDEEGSDEVKECPPLPVLTYRESKQKVNYPFRNMEFEESPFTTGEPANLPELSQRVAKEFLFKSVSAILAHAGYDSAMNSALQVLTDVAEDFLRRFTRRLRHAKDTEDIYGPTGFPDIVERVYCEMGLGSVTSLHDFYQTRILAYREEKKLESLKLMEEYKQCCTLPHTKSPDDPVMRFKKELEDDGDIPEIHFPALGDGDGVDELQPSLEHGFQMLHSLEQEVQMQSNLDQEDEDVNVSDSPQGSEAALSFQPGSEAWILAMKSKKRKRK